MSNKSKIVLASAGIALLSALTLAKPTLASPNYEGRDGISGEIKYAEICNYQQNARIQVIAEATSRQNRVYNVEFKMFSRPVKLTSSQSSVTFGVEAGIVLNGQSTTVTNNYSTGSAAWRALLTRNQTYAWWYDRRFYDLRPFNFNGNGFDPSTNVMFSTHVNRAGGKTIDLGGVVNMGTIPYGTCKVYDDGIMR